MRYHPRVDQGVDTCASVLIISVDPDTYHAVGLKGGGGGGGGGGGVGGELNKIKRRASSSLSLYGSRPF